MFRLGSLFVLCLGLAGCTTPQVPAVALEQQEQADLVVGFQSWNSVSVLKPDLAGMAGAMPGRTKTLTGDGLVKLLRNLKTPRDFVVVILDRTHTPDPVSVRGGMDAIQGFFEELGFRRIVLQDGAALSGSGGHVVLRDTTTMAP
jgi:hypothetical protein